MVTHCTDVWRKRIPPKKLEVYRQMLDEGLIMKPYVVYQMNLGFTFVEYDTDYTLDGIRAEMKRRSEHYDL